MLLRILSISGSLPTQELAERADMTSKQVWGLLKTSLRVGRVVCAHGRWLLVPDFPGCDVARAVELLRRKGWLVQPPTTP